MIRLTAAFLLMASLLLPGQEAWAQAMLGNDENGPIEVLADNGIEWQQENKVFLARGNARATRGDTRVAADILRAYYREGSGQGTEVWRLDAEGGVTITTPGEKATGDQAVYDIDNGVFVLTGTKGVKFSSGPDTVTADRQIEYWQSKGMAVARGNAVAMRQDSRLRADVLTAHFQPDKQGKSQIVRIEAFDNVNIRTKSDEVTADRGVYNVQSGIATVTGSVKIKRGANLLTGCRAEVNLNSGVSRMFSCPPGAGGGRVQGVLVPGTQNKNK